MALFSDSLKCVETLVEMGADVNAYDFEKQTPLHVAGLKGAVNIAKYLVEKGADIMAVDSKGRTALDLAQAALGDVSDEQQKRNLQDFIAFTQELSPSHSVPIE